MFEKLIALFKEADVSFTMVGNKEIDIPIFAFLANWHDVENANIPFNEMVRSDESVCLDEEAHIRIYVDEREPNFLNWGIVVHDGE